MRDIIIKQIEENISINQIIIDECIDSIEAAANFMITAILSGKKILWCGNGGSAADAQHLATELMGGMGNHDRRPIPSIALTTDTSFLTAWSNDTEFESVFSRQIQGIGELDDILVGISTSGNDKNLNLNNNDAQSNSDAVDLSATGFSLRSGSGHINANGYQYIYYAHA